MGLKNAWDNVSSMTIQAVLPDVVSLMMFLLTRKMTLPLTVDFLLLWRLVEHHGKCMHILIRT